MTSVCIESEHNRLKSTVFKNTWGRLGVEQIVTKFREDHIYSERLVLDPQMNAERTREAERSSQKYQRAVAKRAEESPVVKVTTSLFNYSRIHCCCRSSSQTSAPRRLLLRLG